MVRSLEQKLATLSPERLAKIEALRRDMRAGIDTGNAGQLDAKEIKRKGHARPAKRGKDVPRA